MDNAFILLVYFIGFAGIVTIVGGIAEAWHDRKTKARR